MVIMEEKLDKIDEENSETSSQIASTWNTSHETLLAAIADRSNCSRWLHNASQSYFDSYNFYLTVPNIAISTIAGSATIGLTSIFPPDYQRTAATIIGLCTLGCGVLTSINQYMKSAQLAEAHRAAGIAHGKLHRVIASELTLRRDQRLNALDFLKVIRSEQDRLQETSPAILENIIKKFRLQFKDNVELEKPEIVGDLDHVQVNHSSKYESHTPTRPPNNTPNATNSLNATPTVQSIGIPPTAKSGPLSAHLLQSLTTGPG